VSVDPRFERTVLAEFAIRERRGRGRDRSRRARALAETLHGGRHDLLAHLRRVAYAIPMRFRAVAWLHHSVETDVTSHALAAAGLTIEEVAAVELLAHFDPPPPEPPALSRVRALSRAPGRAGYLARVVARAAIEDRLDGQRPEGETVAALRLLPDPGLAR
jgi:hypothetical protein